MDTQLSMFDAIPSQDTTPGVISDTTDWCAFPAFYSGYLAGNTAPSRARADSGYESRASSDWEGGIIVYDEAIQVKESTIPMSESPLQTIKIALLRLAVQDTDGATNKNDVGFSKPDSWQGRRWASQDTLTEDDALAALDMLQKYKNTQLADLVLPARDSLAVQARESEAKAGKIVKQGEFLIVSFPYNKKHVDAVKSLPIPDRRYRYEDDSKSWVVSMQAGRYLLDLFPQFAISETDKAAILAAPIPEKVYPGQIAIAGNELAITFAYDPDVILKLKALGLHATKDKKTGAYTWLAPFALCDKVIAALDTFQIMPGVELSDTASKLYDKTLKALQVEYQQRLAERTILEGGEALVMLTQLRHAASVAKAENACELAQDVIEEGGQVVLFVAFSDTGKTVADCLGTKLFSGETSTQDRQSMVDDFQAGKLKALVCTLGSGGVGITLTAAQTVILVDRPYTPGDATQSEDRLHRNGQQNAVTSLWLQYGEADEAVDTILQAKQERIDLVLQGKRKTLRGTNMSAQEIAQEILPDLLG